MFDVLITGSSGFVGSNLLAKLNKSYQIVCVNRKEYYSKASLSIDYKTLFNEKLKAKVYIHLAGKAHDLKNVTSEKEYFDINYELTKKVYDCFLLDETSKYFIYVSSIKAVTDHSNNIIDEHHPTNPKTAYGRSKLKAEEYLMDNMLGSKKTIILRPCMIYGPENKGNLSLLYKFVNKKLPWPLGAYHNGRSFLSIDNFCHVIECTFSSNIENGIYHVADDQYLSTNELISIIYEVMGLEPRIWNVPKSIIEFTAKAGNIFRLMLDEERLFKLTSNYRVSNEKIKSAIGIDKMPFDAKNSMFKTIKDLSFN